MTAWESARLNPYEDEHAKVVNKIKCSCNVDVRDDCERCGGSGFIDPPSPYDELQDEPEWLQLGDSVLRTISVLRSYKPLRAAVHLGLRSLHELHPHLREAWEVVENEYHRLDHERRVADAERQRKKASSGQHKPT